MLVVCFIKKRFRKTANDTTIEGVLIEEEKHETLVIIRLYLLERVRWPAGGGKERAC